MGCAVFEEDAPPGVVPSGLLTVLATVDAAGVPVGVAVVVGWPCPCKNVEMSKEPLPYGDALDVSNFAFADAAYAEPDHNPVAIEG